MNRMTGMVKLTVRCAPESNADFIYIAYITAFAVYLQHRKERETNLQEHTNTSGPLAPALERDWPRPIFYWPKSIY